MSTDERKEISWGLWNNESDEKGEALVISEANVYVEEIYFLNLQRPLFALPSKQTMWSLRNVKLPECPWNFIAIKWNTKVREHLGNRIFNKPI